jgi:outer membrane immunogenic protein
MRRILLSSAALAALTTASFAADLPARSAAPPPAPVYAPPIFTWTGFYVGAQVGAAWMRDKASAFDPAGVFVSQGTLTDTGFIGGGHVGYNYQIGSIVLGIEGDIEGSTVSKTGGPGFGAPVPLPAGSFIKASTDWQGSVRGRLGYAINNVLLYATGGAAFADFERSYSAPGAAAKFSDTRAGWTVGGGLEYAFTNNWTARVEYRYSDFGKETDVLPAAFFGGGGSVHHNLTEQAVRVGVSYKF